MEQGEEASALSIADTDLFTAVPPPQLAPLPITIAPGTSTILRIPTWQELCERDGFKFPLVYRLDYSTQCGNKLNGRRKWKKLDKLLYTMCPGLPYLLYMRVRRKCVKVSILFPNGVESLGERVETIDSDCMRKMSEIINHAYCKG